MDSGTTSSALSSSGTAATGLLSWELVVGTVSSTVSFAAADVGPMGELRCCSSSYSLIRRFFSECALLDEADGVGELVKGGVGPLLRFTETERAGECLTLDGAASPMEDGDSKCASDGDTLA